MSTPLIIPKGEKEKGLRVWCDKCRHEVSKVCDQNGGQPISLCEYGDRHKFKIVFIHPVTKKKSTNTLATRNLEKAKEEAREFINAILQGPQQLPPPLQTKRTLQAPRLLIEAFSKHLAFLEDVGVPFHKKRELGKKHLADIKKAYTYFLECLVVHNHDPNNFTVDEFHDEHIVGEICEELENSKTFGKTTYNRRLKYYTAFEYWLSKTFELPYKGLFEDVPRKRGKKEPEAITEEEFERLLQQITPENGIKLVNYATKKRENHYYPWLKIGFRLALETGGRRPGIVYQKFIDIIEKNGKPSIIRIPDDKINNQFKLKGDDRKFLNIRITDGMLVLLMELNYDNYRGTERYLLAPEIVNNRHTMLAKLTKAFTHYYSQLNTGRHLTLYSCRRANITIESIKREPGMPTDHHTNLKVEIQHYRDPKMIADKAFGSSVFPSKKKT